MLHKMRCIKFSDAGMEHHTPEEFTRCQWQRSEKVSVIWIIYRLTLGTYTFVTWVLSLVNFNRPISQTNKYFIYLTNWSYLLLTIQFLLGLANVFHRYLLERRDKDLNMKTMPVFYKMYWVCHTISIPSAFVVTTIFWGAVYNPEFNPVDVINVTTHALNSVVMVVDFWLVAHPYRLIHFYWPLCYATIYCIFTIIYHLCGGTDVYDRPYIYAILDWNQPEKAIIVVVIALIALIAVHLVFWGLGKLKQWLRNRYFARKYAIGLENLGMDLAKSQMSAQTV